MSWTPERVERAKKLWAEGVSASRIAAELGGVSRNGVISKMWRAKMPMRVTEVRKPIVKRVPPKRTPAPKVVAAPRIRAEPMPAETVWQPLADTKPIALMDLEPHHCRWPVEGGSCGCNKVPGLPYCETHAATGYQQDRNLRIIPRINVPAFGNTAHKSVEEFLKEPA